MFLFVFCGSMVFLFDFFKVREITAYLHTDGNEPIGSKMDDM